MKVETYNGEILVSGDYQAYIEQTYQEHKTLRKLLERGYERKLRTDEFGYEPYPGGWHWWHSTDVPSELMRYIGAEVQHTTLAVNGEHTTEQEPFIIAGPWPRRGHDVGETDRWVALVWYDSGYSVCDCLPDRAIVLEGWEPSYDAYNVADLVGSGGITCQSDESHTWESPGYYTDREYAAFATHEGARCPECGGKLVAWLGYGDDGYYEDAEIPWNGGESCEECEHADHFGRVCSQGSFTWEQDERCPCTHPFEEDSLPCLPALQCPGQASLFDTAKRSVETVQVGDAL